jgi:hypothetical protein
MSTFLRRPSWNMIVIDAWFSAGGEPVPAMLPAAASMSIAGTQSALMVLRMFFSLRAPESQE